MLTIAKTKSLYEGLHRSTMINIGQEVLICVAAITASFLESSWER